MKKIVVFLLLALLIFGMLGCARTETIYERTVNGETYLIDSKNQTLTHEGAVYTYTLPKLPEGVTFQGGFLQVQYPDGTWYQKEIDFRGQLVLGTEKTSSNYDEKTYPRGEDLCYALEEEVLKVAGQDDRTQAQEKDGTYIVICIILTGLGALNIFLPEIAWWISVGRWIKDAEPSEHAIRQTRIAGVFLIAMGLGVLIFQ